SFAKWRRFRRWTYSARASFTVSRLVRRPPTRSASARRSSSMARLVGTRSSYTSVYTSHRRRARSGRGAGGAGTGVGPDHGDEPELAAPRRGRHLPAPLGRKEEADDLEAAWIAARYRGTQRRCVGIQPPTRDGELSAAWTHPVCLVASDLPPALRQEAGPDGAVGVPVPVAANRAGTGIARRRVADALRDGARRARRGRGGAGVDPGLRAGPRQRKRHERRTKKRSADHDAW